MYVFLQVGLCSNSDDPEFHNGRKIVLVVCKGPFSLRADSRGSTSKDCPKRLPPRLCYVFKCVYALINVGATFDFENVEILGARRLGMAKMHHRAKFRGDRPNRC